MKLSIYSASITAFCLFLIGCGLLLYTKYNPLDEDPSAFCADCISYAISVNEKIEKTPNVRGNRQFFRYALDTSCRGALLTSHHCPKYRREFLDGTERFMFEVVDAKASCRAIRACM